MYFENMFRYIDNKEKSFLFGGYRAEKQQLEWILGEQPKRYEKLYNIRFNKDLFSQRRGGTLKNNLPDYIIVYNIQNPQDNYHLFPCISSSIKEQCDMEMLSYPNPDGSYIVYSLGEEIQSEPIDIQLLLDQLISKEKDADIYAPRIIKGEDIAHAVNDSFLQQNIVVKKQNNILRFIDLFAGIGGIRYGLEQAARDKGMMPICVMTSEIKPYAVKVLRENHPMETVTGDITKVDTKNIPDFDILCAGFPCQSFSSAGKRKGFADTRGTLFFEVERILRDKKPKGFILENVEGLVNHDGGKTLQVIMDRLSALDYKFDYRVLNSKYFGVPQERKRIYIVGSVNEKPNLDNFQVKECKLKDILESGLPISNTPFVRTLLEHFPLEQLYGKSIKDKRGGESNIHSWDLEIKGSVSQEQKKLLDIILTERRKKKWADIIGIDWMDGMPLTLEQIRTFYDNPRLEDLLEDLTRKGYLKLEYPKKLIRHINDDGVITTYRDYDKSKPKGYNIVAGKLSFEVNKVLSPEEIAPTLVAMDMQKLYVGDNGGIRRLTLREGLRLCGYPDDIKFNVSEKDGFDLLGNTVVVPVVKAVAERLIDTIIIK